MKSIGFKLSACMFCIFLIGIAITVGVSVIIFGKVITRESLLKVEYNTENDAFRVDSWLRDHKANMRTLADIVSQMDSIAKDDLQPILRGVLGSNGAYNNVFMGLSDNTAIVGNGYPIEERYDSWKATEQGWYQLALTDTGAAHITLPYMDIETGGLCITVSQAVTGNGEVIGVVGSDILIPELEKMVNDITLDNNGYAMLLDEKGDILMHPTHYAPSADGEFVNIGTVENGAMADLWEQISMADSTCLSDQLGAKEYYIPRTIQAAGWHLVTVLPENAVTEPIASVIFTVILVALAIIAFAAAIVHLSVSEIISKPIIPFTEFMRKAGSTGDLTLEQVDIDTINRFSRRKDEIGQFIGATAGFIGRIAEVSNALEVIAEGDLTVELVPLSDVDILGHSLVKVTSNLNHMFEDVHVSSDKIAYGAKQMAFGAQVLASGTDEQAEAIERLSASISEIAQKTKENADIAARAAALAETIKGKAEKGSYQMNNMMSAVKDINRESNNIVKVIKVIDDLAFQTNILALNAAVEAAHAGQHGRGFAVVAQEVRNLAVKSAEAAKNTGGLIASSIEKAKLGAHIADDTVASLEEIVSGINESNQLVSEIATSSEVQSFEIDQINRGIDQVMQIVNQDSVVAQGSASLSGEMHGQSRVLEKLLAQFKLSSNKATPSLQPGA